MTYDVVIVSLVLGLVSLVSSQTGPGVPCLCLEELTQPEPIRTSTAISNARDGSGRLFVSEQMGLIWIYEANGSRLAEPFADFTSTFIPVGSSGLLGLIFHPEYVNNGLAYVYGTMNSTTGEFYNSVLEYHVSASDPNKLDPETQRIVFQIKCGGPRYCLNGGAFLFGPDNYLYLGHGDTGFGDEPNDAQNKSNHLGAIHRIDVDSRTGDLEYGIPPDNPFISEPTTPPEMYAYGLRQPYQASMDMGDPKTGDGYGRIFIGDVGEYTWEEVDILEAGGNYGWAAYEGPMCFKPELCGNIGPHIEPVASYNHTDYGYCVISGSVYRGSRSPNLNGWFLFTDFLTSLFFGMYEESPGRWEWEVIPTCDTCPGGLTNQYPPYITCMGVSEEGEQYFASTDQAGISYEGTRVFRMADPNESFS